MTIDIEHRGTHVLNESDVRSLIEEWDALHKQNAELAAALEKRNNCPKCKGTGRYLAHQPTIYCTDSGDEIADAYRMAERKCPEYGAEPAAILREHDARVAGPLVEALKKARVFIEYARYELEEGKAVIGDQFPRQVDADNEMARIDEALASFRQKGGAEAKHQRDIEDYGPETMGDV